MKLLIVESPTKGKTIKRFLGPGFEILSSYGHIRDLPEDEFAVDVEHKFKPRYVIMPKAKKNIDLLKQKSKKADLVVLGTDEDREGEAIAWHLCQILGLNGKKPYQRIVFHEITEKSIQEALKNPRKIDLNLVDSQQARRILDRIVGYRLSPFLWKKIARGLSAGRVQSVAVRLVAEREKEIEKFKPQEYWSVEALLEKLTKNTYVQNVNSLKAVLVKKDGKNIPKLGIKNKKEAQKIAKDLKGAEYKVAQVDKKENKRNPLPPFSTSTLQQEAWKRFKFPAKMTMRVAQGLYEKGLTTYHRTDSLNLSDLSLLAAKKFITEEYGKDYWAGFLRKYKTKNKTAQEAHEAIRPTYPAKTPEMVKQKARLDDKQSRLYDLIWRRFIACQMAQARFDSTVVDIEAAKYIFRATGQILKFDGFLKVYPVRGYKGKEKKQGAQTSNGVYPMKFERVELPLLEKDELLKLIKLNPLQHFTQPPARYTEASLIKALEQDGIGRPSTYAPIISTIQARNYIAKNEKKRFQPTEIGLAVNDLLVEHFPKIVDIKFTARMEEDLDEIAEGKQKWMPVVKEFYGPFMENLEKKSKKVKKMVVETKEKCQKCGKSMVIRMGKYGKFLACSGFPECKNTKELPGQRGPAKAKDKASKEKCHKCGKPMVHKIGRYGEFLACSGYPECRNIKNIEKQIGMKCPECGQGEVVEKHTRSGKKFWGCNRWPDCDFASWQNPKEEKNG